MINTDKLRGKIVERRMTLGEVAKKVGISPSTLSKRLNHRGGAFTIDEAEKIARVLQLSCEELNNIFFAEHVA